MSPVDGRVLIHGSPRALAELGRALERDEALVHHLKPVRVLGELVPHAREARAVVLIASNEDACDPVALVRELRARIEELERPVLVVTPAPPRKMVLDLLREGVSQVLDSEGLDPERFTHAIEAAEAGLEGARRAQDRHAKLLAAVDFGFCVIRMLYDADGEPFDYVFLETNAAFEAHTGLIDTVGRSVRELVPGHETFWYERYGHVASTGESTRFEDYAPALHRWYSGFAMRVGAPERREVAVVFEDITARRRAEQALRESEERALAARARAEAEQALLDAMLRAAPVGIIVADASGKLVRMNPANERLWGLAPFSTSVDEYAEWKGWWADGEAHDGQRLAAEDWAMSRALKGETVPGDIVTIEPFGAPGVRRTMMNSAAPVRGPDGSILGAVIAQMDITARIEAEAAVRLSEERYRLVGRATNDVIWDWDVTTGRVLWNDAVLAHFGETKESIGQDVGGWVARIHPEDHDRVKAGLDAALEAWDVDSWADEYRFRRHDGSYATFLDRGYILRDAQARATRMIGTMLDVTERRRAEVELEESEERFRTLADNISHLAWMADARGEVFWFNRRWYEYTGATPEASVGRGWVVLLDPLERDRVVESFSRAIARGEQWEDTFAMRGRDGELRAFLTRAIPLKNEAGKVVRWLGTNTDVEGQRRLEAGLREAIQVRDTFLQVAAHELRTPLTALTLQLETLDWLTRRAVADPGRMANKVGMAMRQTERLARLIEDLLDVSRITSGRLRLEVGDMDLGEVVRETVERLRDMATRSGCELVVATGEGTAGRWDRSRIEQVVTNLVTNALKYGRGRPVEISAERRGATVVLRVHDNGIGIASDDQGRIFERFERAVSADHYGGLGLGLYIAREIVQAHGGRIFVESSSRGGGTTFTVTLPAMTPRAAGAYPAPLGDSP